MKKVLFNKDWRFCFNPDKAEEELGILPKTAFGVDIPHDWSIKVGRNIDAPSGRDSGYFLGGTGYYYKQFSITSEQRNRTIMLEFEGIMQFAEIYVNGNLVATHTSGYTAFVVDITKYLNQYGKNLLKVVVTNPERNSEHYTGSGINRNIHLLVGETVFISPCGIRITTPEAYTDRSKIVASTEVINSGTTIKEVLLKTTIFNQKGRRISSKKRKIKIKPQSSTVAVINIKLKKAQLWSPETPFVYSAVSELFVPERKKPEEASKRDRNAPQPVPFDVCDTKFGIRSIELVAGDGFLLNGVPLKLKGGCVQLDNGLLGSRSNFDAEFRKLKQLRDCGYNAVRILNPPSDSFLDACDQVGLMSIVDIFDAWDRAKRPLDNHLFFAQGWHSDIDSVVKRNRNHPSIIMWSLGNGVCDKDKSGKSVEIAKKLSAYTKEIDPTRPVTLSVSQILPSYSELEKLMADREFKLNTEQTTMQKVQAYAQKNDLFGKHTPQIFEALDVAGYNYLHSRYHDDLMQYKNRMIVGSSRASEAYEAWDAVERNNNVIGDFNYTAVDFLGMAGKGAVDADFPARYAGIGEIDIIGCRRPHSYFRSVLWGEKETSFIAVHDPEVQERSEGFALPNLVSMWNFPRFVGKPIKVDVYTGGEVVALFLNDRLLGRKLAGKVNKYTASFDVPYHPGKLVAICYNKGTEVSRYTLQTASSPKAIKAEVVKKSVVGIEGGLVYVDISVVDKEGVIVPFADREITVEVEGVADLEALGSAQVASHEDFAMHSASVHNGRLLAILRLTGDAGRVNLLCTCEGLRKAKLGLSVK